jgi:enoyl-CoA hydratase
MGNDTDVILEEINGLGLIRLNRPQSLNALTKDMLNCLNNTLAKWSGREEIEAVLTRGDRAFCAGGDVKAMCSDQATSDERAAFCRVEYSYNRRLFRFSKPHIALMDGVTMGGGLGISVHGSHRVVTERTLCAMPETGIGLFPDIGASYVLPRCPGMVGLYLALTGVSLNAADSLYAGLATHTVPSQKLGVLEEALISAGSLDRDEVEKIISCFSEDLGRAQLDELQTVIDRCFDADSVEEILVNLNRDGSQWARDTAAAINRKSPTSLKIAFRQMREGAGLSFEACMTMEFRLARHCIESHDFHEGVRAVLIDRDNAPAWRPAKLVDVRSADVDSYFAPVADELTFPEGGQ